MTSACPYFLVSLNIWVYAMIKANSKRNFIIKIHEIVQFQRKRQEKRRQCDFGFGFCHCNMRAHFLFYLFWRIVSFLLFGVPLTCTKCWTLSNNIPYIFSNLFFTFPILFLFFFVFVSFWSLSQFIRPTRRRPSAKFNSQLFVMRLWAFLLILGRFVILVLSRHSIALDEMMKTKTSWKWQ